MSNSVLEGSKYIDDNNLEERTFATLKAVKGKQFGKSVYSTVIKFADLRDFLEIFPQVQRNIIPSKVRSLKRYILSGLDYNGITDIRFFSAVTVTCKGTIYYNDDNNRLGIDIFESKLSINDGQHRHQAITELINELEDKYVKSSDKEKSKKLGDQILTLKEMVVPVVIFDGLSETEEKQLFHDLNNLAQRPSRNANIRLNQTDIYSRMARDISESNKYLQHLGVETDKMSILGNNPNSILLSTIYSSIRELMGVEGKRLNRNVLNNDNYDQSKEMLNSTFDTLFFTLPPDINHKGKYILEKSYAIKAIARFIYHCRSKHNLSDNEIFSAIEITDWTYSLDPWESYGGMIGSKGNILFGGGTGGGFRAVFTSLMDKVRDKIVDEVEVTTNEVEDSK